MIYLLLFLLPVQLGTFLFLPDSYVSGIPVDYLAPALYVTDLVFILIAVKHWIIIRSMFLSKKFLLLLGLLLVNAVLATSPVIGLFKLLKILEVLILYFIIKKSAIKWDKVLWSFLAMGMIQLFLSIFHVTQGHALQGVFYMLGERFFTLSTPGIATVSIQGIEVLRAYGTFSHPNSLAGFYLLLYTFFIFQKSMHHNSRLVTIFLAICSLLIVLSFSKMAILTYLLVTLWQVIRTRTTCTLCTVSQIAIPLVLAGIVLGTAGDAETIDKRIWLTQTSLLIIKEYVVTGVGLGNYLLAQAAFPIPYSYFFLQPVHNILLLLLAELGIPLFILISYFFIPGIKIVWKSPIGKALLIVVLVTGFFDHYWWTLQQNLLLLPVIFGLLQSKKDMIK